MAAEINIVQEHARGIDEAKRRIVAALAVLARTHRVQGLWANATTYTVTSPVKGSFTIEPTRVRVHLQLGVLTVSLKPQIEAGIKAELTAALA